MLHYFWKGDPKVLNLQGGDCWINIKLQRCRFARGLDGLLETIIGCSKCYRFGPMIWRAKTATSPCRFIKACTISLLLSLLLSYSSMLPLYDPILTAAFHYLSFTVPPDRKQHNLWFELPFRVCFHSLLRLTLCIVSYLCFLSRVIASNLYTCGFEAFFIRESFVYTVSIWEWDLYIEAVIISSDSAVSSPCRNSTWT